MRVPWSRLAGLSAGLLIGALFLALAFRGTPVGAVLHILAGGDWGVDAHVYALDAASGAVDWTASIPTG